MGFVHGLGLALRALRWRAKASLLVLVVAVLASAAAAMGPLYSRSAQDSLLRDRLAAAGVFARSVAASADLTSQPGTESEALSASERAMADPRLDHLFGPAEESLDSTTAAAELMVGGSERGFAYAAWRTSMCTSIRFTAGRCPTRLDEIAISAQARSDAGLFLGQRLRLGLNTRAANDTVTVVGVYDRTTARGPAFAVSSPEQAMPPTAGSLVPQLDLILASRPTLLQDLDEMQVSVTRTLPAADVHVGDLPALTRALAAVSGSYGSLGRAQYTVSSPLTALIATVDASRDQVAHGAAIVTAQLVVLAWFVLFLVLAATTEERSAEVAVAKLRGMRSGATVVFVLTEPLLLLTVATPLGLAVALAADRALTSSGLGPGTQVLVDGRTILALAAAFLGGLVACVLAVRRVLTVPVLAELRRTGGRRARLARTVALDAAVVTAAALGVWELRGGGSDTLVLLVPALLALAAGVPAARLVPVLAALEVRRTRRSTRIGSFLAARNLARRPAGARFVVLLTVAVSLAVFAVDGWTAAGITRSHQARQQIGAATVLHVEDLPPARLLDAVRAADPGGREAMAAVQTPVSADGALLAVDTSRFAAVTSWDPAWARTSMARLVHALAPPAIPALTLLGPSVSVDTRYTLEPGEPRIGWTLSLRVLGSDATVTEVALGIVRPGVDQLTGRLPADCDHSACRLLEITLERPFGQTQPATGIVEITSARDSRGSVPAASSPIPGTSRWRVAPNSLATVDPSQPADAFLDTGQNPRWFAAALAASAPGDIGFTTSAYPRAVPVLQGSGTLTGAYSGLPDAIYATGLGNSPVIAHAVSGGGVLPRIGTNGSLADLGVLVPQSIDTPLNVDDQVWLASGAPAALRTRLTAHGIRVVSVQTQAARTAVLDRDAAALSLRLFLAAAGTGLLLAAATVLTGFFVAGRRRSYELAAVLALGARRSSLATAGRREQLSLVLFGAALGTAAGLLGTRLVLPRLPTVTGGSGPLAAAALQWLPVAVTVLVTVAAVSILTEVGARRVVRLASPDQLRAVQA